MNIEIHKEMRSRSLDPLKLDDVAAFYRIVERGRDLHARGKPHRCLCHIPTPRLNSDSVMMTQKKTPQFSRVLDLKRAGYMHYQAGYRNQRWYDDLETWEQHNYEVGRIIGAYCRLVGQPSLPWNEGDNLPEGMKEDYNALQDCVPSLGSET